MGKGREFLKDWVACLIDMIMKNAGFTAGQEISDDQNEAWASSSPTSKGLIYGCIRFFQSAAQQARRLR